MKTILSLLLLLTGGVRLLAQSQELQQLKLDLEKLAQFKLILSNMKQGYQTLQSGYNAVRDAAKGNFDLHKSYLDGLLRINPSIKNSPALKGINKYQVAMEAMFQNAWRQFVSSTQFSTDELAVLRSGYDKAREHIADEQDMVALTLSNGALRMSDEERLQIITTARNNVSAQVELLRGLISDYTKAMALRVQQKKDLQAVKRLSGVK